MRKRVRGMVKAVVSGLRWTTRWTLRLARGTATFVGLVVMLAVVLGVASTAAAHTGYAGLFHLNHSNTVSAISKVVGSVAGPILRLDNNSTGTGATALDLQTEKGKPPMTVNQDTKVANLNADWLDGKDSSAFIDGAELPSGQTLRGTWGVAWTPTETSEEQRDSISFGLAVPGPLQDQFLRPGQAPSAECPGTPTQPEAAPGFLCIYQLDQANTGSAIGGTVLPNNSMGGSVFVRSSPDAVAAGRASARGSWAVTPQ